MSVESVLGIVGNIGTLALLALFLVRATSVVDQIDRDWWGCVVTGVLCALAATVVMFDPVSGPGGVLIDARGAPLLVAGVLGGPVAGFIAAAAAVAVRASIGGVMAQAGILAIAIFACVGCAAGVVLRRQGWRLNPLTLGGMGAAATLAVIPSFFVGHADTQHALTQLKAVWPTLLAANIAGTVLLGAMITMAQRRRDLTTQLEKHQEEASKLALVASRTTNAVIITDAQGRIEWVNAGFERLTGYPMADVAGRRPGSFLQGPETHPDTVATMGAALARGEGFSVELVNYTRDRQPYWVSIECQPVIERGRLVRFVAIETDVSQQRKLNDELLRAEQLARAGHWVLELPNNNVRWSAETYRILGLPAADGPPDLDGVLAVYHSDERDAVRETLETAIARAEGFSLRARLAPGNRAEWVEVRAECAVGPDGKAARMFGTVQDVSEEMAARAVIEESEARLRTLMDAMPAEIDYVDRSGLVVYANLACRRSAGRDDLTGRDFRAEWPDAVPQQVEAAMQRAQRGERATYRASWTPADQQTERVFDTTLVPNFSACGEMRGVFGIAFDVTDYERREAELRAARDRADAANRAKSVFLATMSHELRTPLNAINGYAEILRGELFGPLGTPRYVEYAGDILTSGRYLRDLIEGVLSLSSIEAGKQDLQIEAIDLGDLLYEVHRMLASKAKAKGIAVTFDIPEEATVAADPRAIKQVVTNTLENAVKFTPEGGFVGVSATCCAEGWELQVRDTGCGIPSEHLGRITEPFYRGVQGINGLVTNASGTGIGLALVDRYLRAMDGRLEIDSQVGEGTCVTITLPSPGTRPKSRRLGAASEWQLGLVAV